jgi:7,8-dihydroneopterin aldolase/epimerase/oxygenase
VNSNAARDKILIKGLRASCILGVPKEERKAPQEIRIDLELFMDFRKPSQSDRIGDAIDYEKVCRTVTELVEGTRFHLIEALAESVAGLVLKEFSADAVMVRIFKPKIIKNAETVGVEIHRRR